jgi:hypothetical protein
MKRILLIALVSVACLGMGTLALHAQPYPSHPIQLLTPGTPGLMQDVTCRLFGEEMGKVLNTQIVVMNKPGASMTLATDAVATYFTNAHELPAVTVALGARYRVRNKAGERWIPAEEFFVGLFTTLLQPDELVVEVALPPMPPRSGWSFQEVARQSGALGWWASPRW